MNNILLIDSDKSRVNKLFKFFKKKYAIKFATDLLPHLEAIDKNPSLLVLLGTDEGKQTLSLLQKHRQHLDKRVILVNHGEPMDYILECFKYGALNVIESNFNESEAAAVVNMYFSIFKAMDTVESRAGNLKVETKELELKNKDVYDSEQIHAVLKYLMRTIQSLVPYDSYIGLMNSIYEILVNAMEHGNLGIGSKLKEKLLSENKYNELLKEKLPQNHLKILVTYKLEGNELSIAIKDEGKGFDYHEDYNNNLLLSGRGYFNC